MCAERLGRRALLAAASGVALGSLSGVARARGRAPVGGRLTMRVPWPVGSVDPHRLGDPMAAIFGEALFDGLYAFEEGGAVVPALAETAPEPEGKGLRVRLRAELRTAKSRPITPADVARSLERARSLDARAWLADVPRPKVSGHALVFATRDAARLARALASPLAAVVPSGFSPEAPDGTGPFRFASRGDAATLTRNVAAARGPALLDEVVVRAAPDLAASLRAFESGADDVGWLGSGLHEPRAGSRPFDLGRVAWAVLFTGRDARSWDAPGVAQRLCDGIPPSRLSYLALGPSWSPLPLQGWGGPPAPLLVRGDAPWLVELAKAIAATISRSGHEVSARAVSASELAQRRASRSFGLALDVVRPAAPTALGARVALATADRAPGAAALVKSPPKLGAAPARTMTRTLRCGVVGDVRVQGGAARGVSLAPSPTGLGLDLGSSTISS